ncbi:HET-domain-containing protein [Pyrenochaeta sp. DS3sAY3a]|nr:HET-domain-containing protein [Pyrenochaeta sp. DS3sAY3a]
MPNYAGLPAWTHQSNHSPRDETGVIEFLRLVYPLDYCDGWKTLFSSTENLTQLLSKEGCVLSSTCSYDPKFESQPKPCCRLCIFLGIESPGSRLKFEYERTPSTNTDAFDGGGSQPRHPLENVLLKRIINLSNLSTNLAEPRYLFTDKGDEAESFLAQTAELDISGWASKINTAVSRCCQAGQSCAPRPQVLPRRLIRVQDEDLGEENVRLYETTKGELGNYVALSYVWGGPQPVTTTNSNIAQHLAAISVNSLGKTIRDAITFVRALGIRYVWVDALCIVQDSDNTDEINSMGTVYRDAWLVIAAEASHGVDQGFLQEWPVRRSPLFDINLPNGRSGTVMIGAGGLDPMEVQARPEPLRSRGWAFQESALGRRLLTFHSESISYECTTESHGAIVAFDKTKSFEDRDINNDRPAWWAPTGAIVTGSRGAIRPTILTHRLIEKGLRAAQKSGGETDAGDLPSLILAWREITLEYAERQLTVEQDRLPAIAGVAAHFAVSIGPESYLAGLWKPYLVSHLAWLRTPLLMAAPGRPPIDKDVRSLQAINSEGMVTSRMHLPSATSSPAATLARYRKHGRSPILQSPTWSWCTHQHSCHWLNGLGEDAIMITSTRTLVSDNLPYGAVLHASITVQAQCLHPSAMENIFNWSDTYLYMDYSDNVMAECGIEPSLYMLLGTTGSQGSLYTLGLVLRACKEDSQQCLLGKSMRVSHYQRIGIIRVSVSSFKSSIWYGPKAQRAILTLV